MSQFRYHVDIVFCIDRSGSMRGIINSVKDNALTFHQKLHESLNNVGKHVDQIRVRFVGFTGYYDNLKTEVTDFMMLPEESEKMKVFLENLSIAGGDDEMGLEALALAIQSDWDTSKHATKRRHIILMYSDEPAHELSGDMPGMQVEVPSSLHELANWWGQRMDRNAKRLVLITCNKAPWTTIANWDNTVMQSIDDPDAMSMDGIMSVLVNSI